MTAAVYAEHSKTKRTQGQLWLSKIPPHDFYCDLSAWFPLLLWQAATIIWMAASTVPNTWARTSSSA